MDVDVVVALIAVTGTLLGAAAGAGVTLFTERLRWQREDRVRFLADKRKLYGRVLTTFDQCTDTVVGVMEQGAPFKRIRDAPIPALAALAAEATLVADDSTTAAMMRMMSGAARLGRTVTEINAVDPSHPAWAEAKENARVRRLAFVDAVRVELGFKPTAGLPEDV